MHSRLKADHDDLRLLIHDFMTLLNGSRPDRMAELFRQRTGFSKRFRQHLALEDTELRGRADGGNPALQGACTLHGEKRRSFFLRYSAHIKCWTPERIAADWEGYKADVTALAREHRQMMDWEERALHPLLVD